MIVRPATAADADAIRAILNHYIRETTITFKPHEYTIDQIEDLIASTHAIFVAESGGNITGYANYGQFRNGLGYGRTMEHSILMVPGALGKGGGRALMTAIEDHASQAGAGSLWAGVSGENPEGLAFHKAIGFDEIATLPKVGFKFGRWIDLTLLRKALIQ